jgi:hypothetical protein
VRIHSKEQRLRLNGINGLRGLTTPRRRSAVFNFDPQFGGAATPGFDGATLGIGMTSRLHLVVGHSAR